MAKQFRDFESAREFVRKLNLKTQRKWFEYCKSGDKPDNIPYSPNGTYKNNGWSGFGDWLGTGNVAPQDRVYQSFTEAREFVRKLNLKTWSEWFVYCKSGKKPDDIPGQPWIVYKEWSKNEKTV